MVDANNYFEYLPIVSTAFNNQYLIIDDITVNTKPRSDFKTPRPSSNPANPRLLSAIALSPTNQPSPSLFTPIPNARASSKRKTAQSGKDAKRPKERMKHNIPHRLVMGLNTRATKCGVCVDTIHFGRQAAKCQGTLIICIRSPKMIMMPRGFQCLKKNVCISFTVENELN